MTESATVKILTTSRLVYGTVIYALDDCALVSYKSHTVYGVVTIREWFDWRVLEAQP